MGQGTGFRTIARCFGRSKRHIPCQLPSCTVNTGGGQIPPAHSPRRFASTPPSVELLASAHIGWYAKEVDTPVSVLMGRLIVVLKKKTPLRSPEGPCPFWGPPKTLLKPNFRLVTFDTSLLSTRFPGKPPGHAVFWRSFLGFLALGNLSD